MGNLVMKSASKHINCAAMDNRIAISFLLRVPQSVEIRRHVINTMQVDIRG
jgi:hypothetical protein